MPHLDFRECQNAAVGIKPNRFEGERGWKSPHELHLTSEAKLLTLCQTYAVEL